MLFQPSKVLLCVTSAQISRKLQWYLPSILHCNGTCLGSCIWRVMTACTGLVPSHWDGLVPSHWEIDDSLYWPQTTDRPQTDHRQTKDSVLKVHVSMWLVAFLLLPSSSFFSSEVHVSTWLVAFLLLLQWATEG